MTPSLPLAKPPTKFIHARVDLPCGRYLIVDGNSKITGANGTYAEPRPNALSLPAASVDGTRHCPGSTPACRESCYVKGLAQHAPEVYAAYQHNADTLGEILSSGMRGFEDSASALGGWIAGNAPHGFRWHVSGDVQDQLHAHWIRLVCRASPYVQHWIYTRTLDAVSILINAPNLAVNLSSDAHNLDAVRGVHARYPERTRIAHMVREVDPGTPALPAGSVLFPDYALRGRNLADPTSAPWWQGLDQDTRKMVCPADFFGQSEYHRCGPCRKCM